ncbi:HD-GYP domain-containing protein [Metabacillus sp. Hm71]|uniref:HD-GYP domain-containing protein n=1 Tax=Metabacillus sp. Hm71 TaxID=3450743 RepID=UPI003F438953
MKIHINQLEEGCILAKDILSASNKVLAYKKTIVTEHIKHALKAFLVNEVHVENLLEDGRGFLPSGIQKEASNEEKEKVELTPVKTFHQLYNHAVMERKQLFTGWQSGTQIEIAKVRQIILPLISELKHQEGEILKLYQYCKKEDYLSHHSVSVALLSAFLAKRLGYDQGEINQIAITGLLCDCGMARISPVILTKKVTLTEREYLDLKQHPVHSYNLLKSIMSLKEGVKMGVLQHHERMDGSGYPLGVKGDQAHPYSKIVALADTYQAMVSERPYRSKQSPFKVLEQIMQHDFGRFELNAVNELKKAVIKFSAGTKVKLSNGLKAEIVFVDEQFPTRPIVKIEKTGDITSLKDKKELYIQEIF